MSDLNPRREFSFLLATAAGFFGLALLSNTLSWSVTVAGAEPASVRLAGGLLLGVLMRRQPPGRWLAGYLAAAFLAWAMASVLSGRETSLSLLFAVARIAELLAAYLVVRAWGLLEVKTPEFLDYMKLLVAALGIAPVVGILITLSAGQHAGPVPVAAMATNWWTGNALGMLIMLPATLAWESRHPWRIVHQGSAAAGAGLILLSLSVTAVALFQSDNAFILISLPLLVTAFALNRIGFSIAALGTVLLVVGMHRLYLPQAAGLNAIDGDPMSFPEAMFYSLCAIFPASIISFMERVRTDMTRRLLDMTRQLTTITDGVPALIAYIDAQQTYRFANQRYLEWFGIAPSEVIGMRQDQLLAGRATGDFEKAFRRAMVGEVQNFEARVAGRDVQVSYIPDSFGGQQLGVFVLATDITDRKHAQDALFEEKERAQVTLASIGDAVIACDVDMRVTAINSTAVLLTGWDQSDALGRHFNEVVNLVSLNATDSVVSPMAIAIRENKVVGLQSNAAIRLRDGREVPVEDSAAPIRDRAGKVIGGVMVFHDVSESKAMALRMSYMAQHDALTDLPNRVLLKDRLAQAVTLTSRGGNGALVFLDLDHFKRINESLGHDAGDSILREVAARLRGLLRDDDTVSREGGDEFGILLARLAEPHDAARIAQRILATLSAPFSLNEQRIQVSASIGIALFPQDSTSPETLIKQADIALFHAKRGGRGRFSYFMESMSTQAEKRLGLEGALRAALENGDLFLCYQPKVVLPTRAVIGMEALVRWRKPDGTVVPPGEFIPVAEECGLITLLDEWVIGDSIAQMGRWLREGIAVPPVSVNVSLARIDHQRLTCVIQAALASHGVPPALFEVEFTESQTFASIEDANATILALKDIGVSIAMDDFGTGYSSFGYLLQHAFDTLKIDQSFVAGLPLHSKSQAVIQAIMHMAIALECKVVAEGVETHQQADALLAMGCHEMQGYLYGRPMPASDMGKLLVAGIV